jgi:hypothetical protein
VKILAIVIAAAMLVPGCMFSQGVSSSKSLPPGFIDGSKTPVLIPDSLAFRLVFLNLRLPTTADQAAVRRQNSKLNSMGLTDADATAMKGLLNQFDVEYTAWQSSAPNATVATQSVVDAQANAIVQRMRDALIRTLAPDGVAKVFVYVQQAKSRMLVRP